MNVIPARFSSRWISAVRDAPLDRLFNDLLEHARAIASRRGLDFSAEEFYRIAATPCDIHPQNVLGRPSIGTGALAIAAQRCRPRCDCHRGTLAGRHAVCALQRGVSHHPAGTSVMAEDVAWRLSVFASGDPAGGPRYSSPSVYCAILKWRCQPGTVDSVAINGAETTAGSMPQRLSAIGITDDTIAPRA